MVVVVVVVVAYRSSDDESNTISKTSLRGVEEGVEVQGEGGGGVKEANRGVGGDRGETRVGGQAEMPWCHVMFSVQVDSVSSLISMHEQSHSYENPGSFKKLILSFEFVSFCVFILLSVTT